MAEKKQPVGICDLCEGSIPRSKWYTSKRKPRLHCSRDCRNTANSRAGSAVRSRKAKKRVAAGAWQNPHHLNPPTSEEQAERARKGRKREVQEGSWRNPALTEAAKVKLSRPRRHEDNLVLHGAIERLKQGDKVSDLSDQEQEAYREYRRKLYEENKEAKRAWYRDNYRKRQSEMTDEEREAQRAKWRKANQKRKKG